MSSSSRAFSAHPFLQPSLRPSAGPAFTQKKYDSSAYDPRQYQSYASAIIEVTPELADWWLTNFANPNNGRVLKSHQDKMVRSILSGQFEPTPDHIAFDVDGMLFNGHNRLTAITNADVPVRLAVCFGFPTSACEKTDKGVTRTGGHTFHMRGVLSANIAHAICAAIFLHEAGRPMDHCSVSAQEALEIYDRDPETMDRLVNESRPVSVGCGITHSVIGSMMYACRKIDRQDAEVFFSALRTGVGDRLREDSPVIVLRRRITGALKRNEKLHKREQAAFIAKAWNAFRQNRTMGILRWSSEEGFPELV